MHKRNLIARWKKTKRNYQYKRKISQRLTRAEIDVLQSAKRRLAKQNINITIPQLRRLWFKMKRRIRHGIRRGHVRIPILEFVIYWAEHDEYFSRLQVAATGNLKKLFDFYKEWAKSKGFSNEVLEKFRNHCLKGWREK